jgi:hypothetical protein
MTTPPAVYGQFGQTLAFAERTLTATLREHLAKRDTQPETWYALRLIAARGPGRDRDALSRDLEGSPNLDADSTHALLARLEADGLIRGDAESTSPTKDKPGITACASTSPAPPPGC